MGTITLLPKMEKFRRIAQEAGWDVAEPAIDDNGDVIISALRGDEKCWISWNNGIFTGARYFLAGVEQKMFNASALQKQMQKAADYRIAAKRSRRRSGGTVPGALESGASGETSGSQSPVRGALPFDPDAADADILRACYNKTVVWQNSITGAYEEAHIRRGVNWDKIKYNITTSSSGRRSLNFVTMEGFRSVAIDRLLQVK